MPDWIVAQLRVQAPGFWLLFSLITAIMLLLFWRQIPLEIRANLLLVRWLLIPYFGLLGGGLSPRLLGLTDLDWLTTLGFGLGLVFIILAALVVVRITLLANQPAELEGGQENHPHLPGTGPGGEAVTIPTFSLTPYFTQFLISGAEEFHWSFLRAALWELLLALPVVPTFPLYLATWLAALLAAVEILFVHHEFVPRLAKLVVLATTSVLFLYTRNFWLCWFLHASAWLILNPRFATPTLNRGRKN
jgi:hypothetical protein